MLIERIQFNYIVLYSSSTWIQPSGGLLETNDRFIDAKIVQQTKFRQDNLY